MDIFELQLATAKKVNQLLKKGDTESIRKINIVIGIAMDGAVLFGKFGDVGSVPPDFKAKDEFNDKIKKINSLV